MSRVKRGEVRRPDPHLYNIDSRHHSQSSSASESDEGRVVLRERARASRREKSPKGYGDGRRIGSRCPSHEEDYPSYADSHRHQRRAPDRNALPVRFDRPDYDNDYDRRDHYRDGRRVHDRELDHEERRVDHHSASRRYLDSEYGKERRCHDRNRHREHELDNYSIASLERRSLGGFDAYKGDIRAMDIRHVKDERRAHDSQWAAEGGRENSRGRDSPYDDADLHRIGRRRDGAPLRDYPRSRLDESSHPHFRNESKSYLYDDDSKCRIADKFRPPRLNDSPRSYARDREPYSSRRDGDNRSYNQHRNDSYSNDYEKFRPHFGTSEDKNADWSMRVNGGDSDIGQIRGSGACTFDNLIQNLSDMRFDDAGQLTVFTRDFYIPHPCVKEMLPEKVKETRQNNFIKILHPKDPDLVPNPVLTFEQASFPTSLTEKLLCKFAKPTPIQIQGWPIALSGYDLIGIAETGSGKTLAFILPALVHIKAQPKIVSGQGPIVLVLAPTRELAEQIGKEAVEFGNVVDVRVATLYGQMEDHTGIMRKLRQGVEIVVACPGKLIDFLQRKVVNLRRVTYFVLDEADRLLDMGFEKQVVAINNSIRLDRQLLMWSATWPSEVENLLQKVLPCRERAFHVQIGRSGVAVETIHQRFVFTNTHTEKERAFYDYMKQEGCLNLTLVFCNTKNQVDRLVSNAPMSTHKKVFATKLHGGMEQIYRKASLAEFKNKSKNCLIATEIAARGLDIPAVYEVINFDCPRTIDDYIHRVGRTGRAGAEGRSLSFIIPADVQDCRDFFENIRSCLDGSNQTYPEEFNDLVVQASYGRRISRFRNPSTAISAYNMGYQPNNPLKADEDWNSTIRNGSRNKSDTHDWNTRAGFDWLKNDKSETKCNSGGERLNPSNDEWKESRSGIQWKNSSSEDFSSRKDTSNNNEKYQTTDTHGSDNWKSNYRDERERNEDWDNDVNSLNNGESGSEAWQTKSTRIGTNDGEQPVSWEKDDPPDNGAKKHSNLSQPTWLDIDQEVVSPKGDW